MKHKKGFAAVLLTLIISALLSVSAFAASDGFSDVPEASPFYESVTYLAGQGITYGTGNGRYAPDTPITVRQWATMICRAFDKEDALSDPAGYGGDACINQGYADGWLNLTAMAAPDSRLCRYAIYESGFAAFDIALYSSQLYPEGETLSSQDNAFHAAVSFGLCEDTCAGTDIITRGEAADLLYALLTGEFTVAPPPILKTIPLNNKEGVHLNSYLLELQKIPEPIRQAFAERGWQYTIDYEYLAKLSEERNMSCIGATNYGSRQITVSSAGATIHEFGHFLDELMGFPSQTEGFYQQESGTAAACSVRMRLPTSGSILRTASCTGSLTVITAKNGGALQRRTKNIRISFDIGKSKLAAGCIGLPAWLGLFETPQHCYYTVPCPASSIKLTAIRLKSDGCTVALWLFRTICGLQTNRKSAIL